MPDILFDLQHEDCFYHMLEICSPQLASASPAHDVTVGKRLQWGLSCLAAASIDAHAHHADRTALFCRQMVALLPGANGSMAGARAVQPQQAAGSPASPPMT